MNHKTPEDSAIEFPCQFPIKAMGQAGEQLELAVVDIVRRHAPDLQQDAIQSRPSANGNYLSITVTITAQSRAQLDAIYMELTACEHVLMAL
jgi:putative lipoic acid-binding regulatory protein